MCVDRIAAFQKEKPKYMSSCSCVNALRIFNEYLVPYNN
jgi:hypothetical protein